jgi:branched-chain amino acid transport system substrate-binding protein
MYVITALPPEKIRNQWDIFTASGPVPGAGEPLEAITSTPEENGCKFAT